MAQNFETRQNDVVETSNNSWWGDLIRQLWKDLREGARILTWANRREQRRENERKEQEQKEKQDLKKQRESRKSTLENREEIRGSCRKMEIKIDELSRLEWNNRSYTVSHLLGPDQRGQYDKGKKLWLTDNTIEQKWDHAYLIKWPFIQLEIFENYLEDKKNEADAHYYTSCACVIKDTDGDIVLPRMTMWDFRRVVDAINIDLDNKIKEAQDKHKKALERIAWQKIAQNNEKYHQQEVKQADADLESQLWDLA